MKKYLLLITLTIVCLLQSCEDSDFVIDGGVASPFLDMSTYDFLSSRPLFDTLVMSIDKAGLKDMVNGEVTLFATTNFSFKSYIDLMTTRGRNLYNDPNYIYLYDSIPVQVLRDSLQMYIFPGKFNREELKKEGEVVKNKAGTELKISLEPRDDYQDQLTIKPEYVFLTYKRGKQWDAWDAKDVPTAEVDSKERIQTSGLISTNGIIHVMPNTHNLFYTRN